MNLQEATPANMSYMIEAIKSRLKMATAAAMQSSSFSLERYEDIKDIYDVIMSKQNFSISEVEALVSELGQLRNK